jgi:hypothetical protein
VVEFEDGAAAIAAQFEVQTFQLATQNPGNALQVCGVSNAPNRQHVDEIPGECIHCESGRKGSGKRKQFAALFKDASRRKFDLVLFWALDHFSREGMVRTINYLQRLDSYGVAYHSCTEAHLATNNELIGNVLPAVMSSLTPLSRRRRVMRSAN